MGKPPRRHFFGWRGNVDRHPGYAHRCQSSRLPGLRDLAAGGFPITSSSAETANTNNKIIVSRDYIGMGGMDMAGHGTGVAMIAAGLINGATLNCADPAVAFCSSSLVYPENPITGVAPGAWLGNYKVCDDSGACYLSTLPAALGDLVNDAAAVQAATGSATVRQLQRGRTALFMADESGAEAGPSITQWRRAC
jgi:hypothetical protein